MHPARKCVSVCVNACQRYNESFFREGRRQQGGC